VLCGAPIVNSDSFPLDAIFPDHSLVSLSSTCGRPLEQLWLVYESCLTESKLEPRKHTFNLESGESFEKLSSHNI
jgi:hypothetical protein